MAYHEYNKRYRCRNYKTKRSQERIAQRSIIYLAPRLYGRLPKDFGGYKKKLQAEKNSVRNMMD